jgi:outer membrane protein TolC
LHGAMRSARALIRTAWFGWQAGEARQAAGQTSVRAAALALRAATIGLAEEVNFDLEVLEAREQMLDAWSRAQQARYDMILESLKLKAGCGVLRDEDLFDLDGQRVPRTREIQYLTEMRR